VDVSGGCARVGRHDVRRCGHGENQRRSIGGCVRWRDHGGWLNGWWAGGRHRDGVIIVMAAAFQASAMYRDTMCVSSPVIIGINVAG